MFENLTARLKKAFEKLVGKGSLNEQNIEEAIKEVKIALLEADVNFQIVKSFVENIKAKALGQEKLSGISASQQFIKIVNDELVSLLGTTSSAIFTGKLPNIIMLVGLQGAGKTTFAAKLASFLKNKESKKVLLASLDVQRPAAIEQLKILANKNDLAFVETASMDIEERARDALKQAQSYNYLILDTAGRLQTNESLMNELKSLKNIINPHEIIFVADSMLGQESLNIAKSFDETLSLDSVVLTKMDGDSRGGVALSIKYSLNKPIKFISTGEKIEDIDKFYPDRIASRILGFGDIVSFVEKAQSIIDDKKAKELEEKIRKKKFDLSDFLSQLESISKMGPLAKVINLIPGIPKIDKIEGAEKQLSKVKAAIYSMTPYERENPKILNASRKIRIAKGSGLQVSDVNRLLTQFEQLQKMFTMFSGNKFPKF